MFEEQIVEKINQGIDLLGSDNEIFNSKDASVQPNVLLRTAVFSPVGRRGKVSSFEIKDLSHELRNLEVCKKEGYDVVTIKGAKLNVETDFRVWCGVILSFSIYGLSGSKIELKFSEFARNCGYDSKRFDSKLRRQIADSLERLQSQQLSFKRSEGVKGVSTGLLYRAEYDDDRDFVELIADESLWDLYRLDRQVLVSLKILSKLPRSEVAQCLYLYFLSLPSNPHPVSFSRIRDRLQLLSDKKEINRRIRLAIEKLESIRFLEGSFAKKNGETYYLIDKRNKKVPD